jgi:2-phospho-L-lactate guanylyltransferase (CobY/MobA/RfbA family)
VPTIVIPYRGDAKRRLPPAVRAGVAVAMLGDVVEACLAVGRTIVVTDDPVVVPTGAQALLDPGGGQGAAVSAGLALADGHALVVNADLPCVTAEALRRLAAAGLALVAAPDGTTNALSLPDPRVFAALYGPGSAGRFLDHAPFRVVEIPELTEDVDTTADLERLAARAGRRTRALLAAVG